MNIAIFIHGKAGAGKDTFVKALKYFYKDEVTSDYHNIQDLLTNKPSIYDTEDIVVMPFADEVRKELCRLDPAVDFPRLCNDYEYKTKYRKELVDIGDGYRQRDPGIWVDKHYISLKQWNLENKGKIVCIPDMRYSTNDTGDEFAYAKEIGKELQLLSFTVKITASLSARLGRMSETARKNYIQFGMYNDSENAMNHVKEENFDFVCCNTLNLPIGFNPGIKEAALELLSIFELIKNI